ncbi:hypothetical protein pb186bvf_000809 [Paramecium bursaria]
MNLIDTLKESYKKIKLYKYMQLNKLGRTNEPEISLYNYQDQEYSNITRGLIECLYSIFLYIEWEIMQKYQIIIIMNQINVKIIDEKQPISQVENEQMDEPMSKVNKPSILNESLNFNAFKAQAENCRIVLVKLIYLYNQGVQFSEQEVESLFFRITKLFVANSSRLRAMTYKLLKIIMQQKFIHMIFQCLIKDLINENQFIKIEALKFIPFIQDEEYIVQLERFIHNALIDKNQLISSAALVVGIHIVNKYPNLVSKWQFEVVQNIDQKQENLNYHSLILFHEIKKTNLSQFIKIIILQIKKHLQSLMHFQIIKFIKDILPLTDVYKQDLMTYLFQQVDSFYSLIFFQTSKILINDFEIKNQDLGEVNELIEENLQNSITMEEYCSLIMMHNILKISERKQLITQEQIIQTEALCFNFRVTLSSKGILFFIKLGSYQMGTQLLNLFDKSKDCIRQVNFLIGLQEIIIEYPDYNMLVLDFIKCAFCINRQNDLVELAIQIVEQILKFSEQYLKVAYPILLVLAINKGLKNNSNVIKIINKVLLNIQSTKLDCSKLNIWLLYLRKYGPLKMKEGETTFLKKQFMNLENLFSQLRDIRDKKVNQSNKNKLKKKINYYEEI